MYPVIRARNREKILVQKQKELLCKEVMEYLTFPKLSEIDCIEHLFTTRIGGVSKGDYATLNFSVIRGDESEAVLENYRRVGEIFGEAAGRFVATDQTHTTNIRVVTEADAGKGVIVPRDYTDIDGLLTKEKGLILSCFFADCVPLYFVDSVREVIGLAHSGWRGTVAGMGACMVKRMQEEFGCEPKDIQTAIGPSICQACYEISEEVAEQFQAGFWKEKCVKTFCKEACLAGLHPTGELLVAGKAVGKYQLDLWLANYVVLRSAGILPEHISMTDICTNCNPDYLFSHRATGGKRGNLAAFLMLKK
ncbi:MAG: peptidoglycan editing factor PgeF [Lachnospiraceae bacterium]|nr:peptidoglycan editing factor PgeF [Lachnospiraceae bacterium]